MSRAAWVSPESSEAQQFRRTALTLADFDPKQKRLPGFAGPGPAGEEE